MPIAPARIKTKLKSILVLDDDQETVRIVRETLGDQNWRIDGASERHAAAAILRDHQSDVLLLNLDVAREERLDLLWLMRQIRPRTRIILITPTGTPGDVLRAVREHVFSYFSKPLLAEPLKEMIERAADAVDWQDGIVVISARPGWISLRLRCRQLTADRLMQFFRELESPLTNLERENLATAFRVVLLDAIERRGKTDRYQTVAVSYFHAQRSIIYLIQDYEESSVLEPFHAAAVAQPPEGFGVLAARLLVDEVIINEKGNEVLLIKYLAA